MLCKRGVFPVVLAFVVAGLIGAVSLNLNRIERQRQHYQQHSEMLDISYRAAIHAYHVATEIYLSDTIRQPEVLSLLAQAGQSGEAGKAALRAQLYTELKDSYQNLWQYRLRQLHFHLPDGESFLRFHQPDRFGDKLFAIRPSVRIANTEHREVIGFEAGRIIDGFRYVAPLTYRGQPIGSVETSIPFRSVQQAMVGYAPDREYQFVVHAELIQERLFPDFRNMYASSPFSAAWLMENPDRKQPDSALPLSATARTLADRLGSDAETIARMNRNELFSQGLVQGGEGYVISFLPVQEVTGGRGGYLVCYAKEPLVVSLKRSFLLELSAFVGLLTLAFWLLVRWRCSVAELAEQSAHQQYEEALLTQQERVEHEERTRISRELHDGIGQALHAVTLRLKLLLGGLGQDRNDERRMIGELIRDVQVASAELRNLVVSLRPQPLSGMQIDEAIRWLCRDLEKDDGVSLLLQISGDFSDVSDRCCLTLFRVCQEGMTNILKHADAKRVQVSLQRQGNTIALIISDDGVGDALAGKHGGSGLDIMRERAELAGGRLQIDSSPGQGTKIFLELPCQ